MEVGGGGGAGKIHWGNAAKKLVEHKSLQSRFEFLIKLFNHPSNLKFI